ncbi:MAG: hypothetical protein AB7G21_15350 [Dehalococcoidia bacterium]
MTGAPASPSHPHLDVLAGELVAVRTGLVDALEGIPELWLARMLAGPVDGSADGPARAGWTVQHEAAHHAADDAVLIALLEHAARGVEAWSAAEARRLRGEAMHRVQRVRLAPLRAHLAESGERAHAALLAHAAHLDRPFALGEAATLPVAEVLRTQAARARAGLEAVRATFR